VTRARRGRTKSVARHRRGTPNTGAIFALKGPEGANGAGRALTGHAGWPMIASGYEKARCGRMNSLHPHGIDSVHAHPAIITRAGVVFVRWMRLRRECRAPRSGPPDDLVRSTLAFGWPLPVYPQIRHHAWIVSNRACWSSSEHLETRDGRKEATPDYGARKTSRGPGERYRSMPALRKTSIVFLNRRAWSPTRYCGNVALAWRVSLTASADCLR